MSHDLFISYAWVDNEPEPGVNDGWVTQLVAGLERRLARNLGRKDAFNLWIDYEQLRGTQPLQQSIAEQLESSRFLLLFLSPGYVSSDWCREELARFSKLQDSRTRIAIIWVRKLSVADMPAEILDDQGRLDRLAYQFWYEERGVVRTLGDPRPDPSDRRYRDLLDKLAADLAAAIRSSSASGGGLPAPPAPEPPEPPEQSPAQPSAHRPAQSDSKPEKVFVDAGDGDGDLARDIARLLKQEGFSPRIPMTALPGFDPETVRPQQIRDDFERNLHAADEVVFVHHDAPIAQLRARVNACIFSPERGSVPALCQSNPDTFALGLPEEDLKVFVMGEDCPKQCASQLVGALGDGDGDV